jgi:GGDEF domain-containing protein
VNHASSEPPMLERAALVFGVAIAMVMPAVAFSPSDVALLGAGLIGVCVVASLTMLQSHRTLLVGALAGLVFGAAHVAETTRGAADLGPLRVWLPAALAIPGFVALSATADYARAAVFGARDVMARQRSLIEALSLEDPDSGAVQKRPGLEEAQRWITFADRYGMTLSLALVGVDELPGSNGEERSRSVGEYLQEHVRQTDTVARYNDHAFLVALPYSVRDEATAMVKRLARDAIDRAGRTVRGSCVEYGRDGNDLATLLRTAEAGLAYCRVNGLAVAVADGDGRASPSDDVRASE